MLWFRQHVLRRFADGNRGVTAVEYAVIVALFAAGLFGVVKLLNSALQTSYSASGARVGSPQSLMPAPSLPSYNPSAAGCDTSVMFYDPLSGQCQPKVSCDPATQWPNPMTNQCDPSAKPGCTASSKGYDAGTNSCVDCTASRPFDAGTGTCAATPAACTASGTWYNGAALTCDPIPLCTDPAQPYDSGTNACKATPANCSTTSPYDASSSSCKATLANCAALSPARWFNSAGAGTCDPIPTCSDPAKPYDSGTNTCTATAANCAALSPARWFSGTSCDPIPTCTNPAKPYDATTNTCTATAANCAALSPARWFSGTSCDPIPSCTNPAKPYDASTNTCQATATVCAAQSPARWYNSSAGTCDPIPSCTNPAKPYDATTNTCTATAANCAALSPARWFNSGAGTCDAFAVCTASQYWTGSNNTCTTLPIVAKCYMQPNGSKSTYAVMSGFAPNGAVITNVDDPGLKNDVNPTISPDRLGVVYTTPSKNGSWPSGNVITITFDYSYEYVQNGIIMTATQSGSFTITQGGRTNSNPSSTC